MVIEKNPEDKRPIGLLLLKMGRCSKENVEYLNRGLDRKHKRRTEESWLCDGMVLVVHNTREGEEETLLKFITLQYNFYYNCI